MARNIYVLIIFLFVISIYQQMKANQKKEKSYEITKYELVKTENLALLKFELKSKIEGDIYYFIHSPKEMEIETRRYKDTSKKVIKESKIEKEWLLKIPEDGWELLKVKRGYVDNTVLNQSNQPVSVPNSFLLNQAKSTPDGKYQKGVML